MSDVDYYYYYYNNDKNILKSVLQASEIMDCF